MKHGSDESTRQCELVDSVLGTDVEIRSFRIRGTRVHVTAPGLHGTDDRWHVYYSPEETEFPVKVVPCDSFSVALDLARRLAALYDTKVVETSSKTGEQR